MLHVLNGDAVRPSLEQTGIGGDIAVWADPLYEGPVPRGANDAAFREARARFHACEQLPADVCRAMHERWDAALARAATADAVVLWFEHDLHDQMLLVRHLAWLPHNAPGVPVLLICVDHFPGVVPFHGLGQLDAEQLASLFPTRRALTADHFRLGAAAWDAFTGPDPRAIEALLAGDTSLLPFLAPALQRLLEEFPDAKTGLPRTERALLELLAEHGSMTFENIFPMQQRTEEAPFMGDLGLWHRVEVLAAGAHPLVVAERPEQARHLGEARLSITSDGRRALDGALDWIAVARPDRWIGGTHIEGGRAPWRWNVVERRLEMRA